MDDYYRFTEKHALTYVWYSISSTGTKNLEQDIEWVDENGNPITILVGTIVSSMLDYDIF